MTQNFIIGSVQKEEWSVISLPPLSMNLFFYFGKIHWCNKNKINHDGEHTIRPPVHRVRSRHRRWHRRMTIGVASHILRIRNCHQLNRQRLFLIPWGHFHLTTSRKKKKFSFCEKFFRLVLEIISSTWKKIEEAFTSSTGSMIFVSENNHTHLKFLLYSFSFGKGENL